MRNKREQKCSKIIFHQRVGGYAVLNTSACGRVLIPVCARDHRHLDRNLLRTVKRLSGHHAHPFQQVVTLPGKHQLVESLRILNPLANGSDRVCDGHERRSMSVGGYGTRKIRNLGDGVKTGEGVFGVDVVLRPQQLSDVRVEVLEKGPHPYPSNGTW